MSLTTGSNGTYQWLASDEHALDVLLKRRPDALLGKYLAITSIDSGFLALDQELKSAGWESRNHIAYSPQIQSVEGIPQGGYDEWYVFDAPMDLGELSNGDPFDAPLQPGRVQVFINYGGFNLHEAVHQSLTELFWKQLEWISPESYLADGSDYLIFVSRNENLFHAAQQVLRDSSV
jgi:hypothetical protein